MSIARNNDPVTSHIAAEDITQDGTRSIMVEKTLNLLREHPGSTANELEAIGGFKDGQLRKRLHDLFQVNAAVQGPVRFSRITGKPNITWYASEQAPHNAVRYSQKTEQPKQVTVTHKRNGHPIRQFKTFVQDRGDTHVVTFPQALTVLSGDEVSIS